MTDLSIIILSFNTKDLTENCLKSVLKTLKKSSAKYEVVVVDNGSVDASITMLERMATTFKTAGISFVLLKNKENVGFPKGNNQGVERAKGKYILYLNSDVILEKVDFDELMQYMEENPKVGGLTVNVRLPNGAIDPASHRGFPTPWNSFSYFTKLEKITKNIPVLNKIFGGYHLTHLDLRTVHEIDAPAAAFYLTRKSILDKLGGFDDKRFFAYGEDIDLTYRTKKLGYTIIYYPLNKIIHYKSSSGLRSKDPAVRKKIRVHFNQAMKIFYKKHYEKQYPSFINKVVYFFIDLKNRQ